MKKKIDNFINENIIKRKAMFIPILGVAVFMLVGYAAVDKEAPEIISNRVEVSYGEKFDLNIFHNRYVKVSSAYRQMPLFSQRYQSHYYIYGLKKIVV